MEQYSPEYGKFISGGTLQSRTDRGSKILAAVPEQNVPIKQTAAGKLAESGIPWAKACIDLPSDPPPESRPSGGLVFFLIEKILGFLLKPVRSFRKYRNETFSSAFTCYAVLWAIESVLMTLVIITKASDLYPYQSLKDISGTEAGVVFFLLIGFGLFLPFMGGAIVHFGVILVGGKNGYFQTVKAYMYAITPNLVLGWIPIIAIIGIIWSFILEIIGIRELQDLSTGKAIGAIVGALFIIGIIAVILAAVFAAFIFGMAGNIQ